MTVREQTAEHPAAVAIPDDIDARALERDDFRPVAINGWGNGFNAYPHSMAWFDGRVYVGSFRGNLCLIRQRQPPIDWRMFPIDCPGDPYDVDLRAQIWRYDPSIGYWERVFLSPTVRTSKGEDVPREIGYRSMAVFQGRGDPSPALYVGTFAPQRSERGPRILRSLDGVNFEPVGSEGLGLESVSSFRFLVPFKGKLYTSPIGSANNICNASRFPIVYETDDPVHGSWRPVSHSGFGDADNLVIFHMVVFGDHLYASTLNPRSGFQVWRTDGEGEAPYHWECVIYGGAYRGKFNEGGAVLCPFGDALYVGTAIQDGGYDRANKIGPAGGEILRIYPDGRWDISVGRSRLTPAGMKMSASTLFPGFNNALNGYIWQLCEHDGWLYAGTFNWATFLPFMPIEKWPEPVRKLVEHLGVEKIVDHDGGCDLWRTCDGEEWFPVTTRGFDNPYNCGIRTMVSTPHGLAVGVVNPFGAAVAVRENDGWRYRPNPRGGLEIWMGGKQWPQDTEWELPAPMTGRPYTQEFPSLLVAEYRKKKGRSVRSRSQTRPEEFELTYEQLQKLKRKIDISGASAEQWELARDYFNLEVRHAGNIPKDGPSLVVCNHLGTPVFTDNMVFVEDGILVLHILQEYIGRPAIGLGDRAWFDTALKRYWGREFLERIGCVPITLGNGTRLLELGEMVLMFPEGRSSLPPYRIRSFYRGFVRMAWDAQAPVCPTVLIGPHESRLRIERDGKPIFINPYHPLPVRYQYICLDPIDPRDHIGDIDSVRQVKQFCGLIRERMQAAIDEEVENRPLVKLGRYLQDELDGGGTQ